MMPFNQVRNKQLQCEFPKLQDLILNLRNNNVNKDIRLSCADLGLTEIQRETGTGRQYHMFHCSMGMLSRAIGNSRVVETIYLDPDFIYLLDEISRKMFLRDVGGAPNLKHLSILSPNRTEVPVSWITTMLHSAVNLTKLGLQSCRLLGTKDQFDQLCNVLMVLSCTTLQSLTYLQLLLPKHFGLDQFIGNSIASCKKLTESTSSLQCLHIVGMGAQDARIPAENINIICCMPNLTRLILNGICLGPNELDGIAKALRRPDFKLESLVLSSNEIDDKACAILSDVLLNASTCNLQELNVANNKLGPKAGAALGGVLKSNKIPLKILNANNNHFNDEGIIEISKALLCNTSLQKLHLVHCDFSDYAMMYMARSLRSNTTLKDINFTYNHFTNISYIALRDALQSNNFTVQKIALDRSPPKTDTSTSVASIVDCIDFYCRLNASGRGRLLQNDKISKEQLLQHIVTTQQSGEITKPTYEATWDGKVSALPKGVKLKNRSRSHSEGNLASFEKNSDGGFFGTRLLKKFRNKSINIMQSIKKDDNTRLNSRNNPIILSELFFAIRCKPELVEFHLVS